jgi:DNA-binding phage protein
MDFQIEEQILFTEPDKSADFFKNLLAQGSNSQYPFLLVQEGRFKISRKKIKYHHSFITLQTKLSSSKNCTNPLNMNTEDQIIETLKQSDKPMSAGQIAEKTGLDRKVVDKTMSKLKTEEKIISPVRCFWTAK